MTINVSWSENVREYIGVMISPVSYPTTNHNRDPLSVSIEPGEGTWWRKRSRFCLHLCTRPSDLFERKELGFARSDHARTMDSIHRLRSIVLNILNEGDQNVSQQDLFDGLRTHKSQLLNILDVGKRDAAWQRELESGTSIIRSSLRGVRANACVRKNGHQRKVRRG
jgi:hypothetical protein